MHTEPQESCTDCQRVGRTAPMYPEKSADELETHMNRLFELARSGHGDSDLAKYGEKFTAEIAHRRIQEKPKIGNQYCGDLSKLATIAGLEVVKVQDNYVGVTYGGYYFSMKIFRDSGSIDNSRVSVVEVCRGKTWDGTKRVMMIDGRHMEPTPLRWKREQRDVGALVADILDSLPGQS